MADANSSAVVLAGDRGPKDDKARKKKAKVNVQQQPLYPYKLPVHQPGVDGFYCTYGCGTSRVEGGMRRSTSASGRTSWSGEGAGTGARSRGRIRPVTVMYPEEGFVCCHEGHDPGEEVDEYDGTEYEDEEDVELVVGGEEEYVEEYEEYEEEEGK
ncbi:uncharacterized protein LOC124162821 [Ischnura elegans]|uniref:uncharacterized protein LOC124162821 n=1 Tax=Ischnura elegans TaxID=197161 RepID=UPI001ED88840|nr:uncharacterized protein LOC124162821 [Ischnura elegans]